MSTLRGRRVTPAEVDEIAKLCADLSTAGLKKKDPLVGQVIGAG